MLEHLKRANMNVVRVAESAWGTLQTAPKEYQLAWLDQFLADSETLGFRAILGTYLENGGKALITPLCDYVTQDAIFTQKPGAIWKPLRMQKYLIRECSEARRPTTMTFLRFAGKTQRPRHRR